MMQLPPQAYTKETLIQAYNWLRSQPPHVQELAKSPDALVALYSKAQMHGENYLSRTNLQGFKTELKNLASMMGDLDFDQGSKLNNSSTKGSNLNPSSTSINLQNPAFNNSNLTSASSQGIQSTSFGSSTTAAQQPMPQQPLNQQPLNQQPPFGAMVSANGSGLSSYGGDHSFPTNNGLGFPTVNTDLKSLLDSRSLNMIQEVKNHFNLSSESEAIRLLLVLGYQKVRSQF